MEAKEREFLKRLLATFVVEANEHVSAMTSSLVSLEQDGPAEKRGELIESAFREAHSLKGAARAVNLTEIESLCQTLESDFSDLKARDEAPSSEQLDRLHWKLDTLNEYLRETGVPADLRRAEAASGPGPEPQNSAEPPPPLARQPAAPGPTQRAFRVSTSVQDRGLRVPESMRVPTFKVDSLLRDAEDFIPAKAAGALRLGQLQDIRSTLLSWDVEWKKARPQVRALQRFFHGQGNGRENGLPQLGEILPLLLRHESTLQSIASQLDTFHQDLERDTRALDRKVTDLVTDVRQLSMLPFSSLLEAFPKLVRDLCRACGKDAELFIEGSGIEADRRILEEIKDPLMHLVRNCIDHGIESPHERERKQKAPKARISITFLPQGGGKVEIIVHDDGAGVDAQKVQAAAARMGLIPEPSSHPTTDQESVALVFQSGLSTSPTITEVSGRGLGLAIVREKVERLGGSVTLETEPGLGTTVRLVLPLTMATFRGILVRVAEQIFVLPAMYVERVLRVDLGSVKSVENRETLQLDGRTVPLVRMDSILGLGNGTLGADTARMMRAVLLAWAGEQIAFLVDEVLNEQEIVVKGLGKPLARVRNIQGATILGTGKVIPVLNVVDLFRSATVAGGPATTADKKPKSILIAEDSITTRTLLKNVLESAGYCVRSAADGAEAFAALQGKGFDLLVSDVDMPRLNGFDLTAKLRADRALSELPVVLVTALESAEDRERGLDAGANAYIVKSSFDQSNLLEAVQKLI
jgi:two-component system, chemotaxis family, sensor kinase CheA